MKTTIPFISALVIFLLGGVYFFGEPAAKAQIPAVKTDTSVEKKFDATMNRVEDKVLKAEQLKPEPKPRPIVRIKRVPVVKEVLASEQKILLNIRGDKYEVEPELYKGYILIDVDSIQQAIVDQEMEEVMQADTITQAAVEEADHQIRLWKKFKSIFTRKN